MISKISGINEEKLNSLILDINQCVDELNKKINSIEDYIYIMASNSNFSNSYEIKKHFANVKSNFLTLNNNILSYVSDLTDVKINYASRVTEAALLMKK